LRQNRHKAEVFGGSEANVETNSLIPATSFKNEARSHNAPRLPFFAQNAPILAALLGDNSFRRGFSSMLCDFKRGAGISDAFR
jgi:hypothetical protein